MIQGCTNQIKAPEFTPVSGRKSETVQGWWGPVCLTLRRASQPKGDCKVSSTLCIFSFFYLYLYLYRYIDIFLPCQPSVIARTPPPPLPPRAVRGGKGGVWNRPLSSRGPIPDTPLPPRTVLGRPGVGVGGGGAVDR